VRVKVCGNTDVAGALAAVEAGADAIGFILAPGSPRSLTPARVREVAREMPPSVDLIGVFVDASPAEVAETAAEAGLTAVQLHGSTERWEDFASLDLPVIRGLRLGSVADAAAVAWPPGMLLLADSHHPTLAGGTGQSYPWEWAADLAERWRLIVSGGLAADNVGDAIRALRPWGVDASSRLESSPGVKDPDRVRAFVLAARRAETEVFGGEGAAASAGAGAAPARREVGGGEARAGEASRPEVTGGERAVAGLG
jgi:phosphoribosylanthranilate isomerase